MYLDLNTICEINVALNEKRKNVIKEWVSIYSWSKKADNYWALRLQEINDAQAEFQGVRRQVK